jgi:hypothetical protein
MEFIGTKSSGMKSSETKSGAMALEIIQCAGNRPQ